MAFFCVSKESTKFRRQVAIQNILGYNTGLLLMKECMHYRFFYKESQIQNKDSEQTQIDSFSSSNWFNLIKDRALRKVAEHLPKKKLWMMFLLWIKLFSGVEKHATAFDIKGCSRKTPESNENLLLSRNLEALLHVFDQPLLKSSHCFCRSHQWSVSFEKVLLMMLYLRIPFNSTLVGDYIRHIEPASRDEL